MNEFLLKDKKYTVITNNIKNTTTMKLFDFDDNFLYFDSSEFNTDFIENDTVEIYTKLEQGIWYAKTNVITYHDNRLKLALPVKYEFLQRRKNERLLMNHNIKIGNNDILDDVTLKDLSIGGIKILTDKQVLLKQLYKIYLHFDNLNLTLNFIPLRLAVENDKFAVSGTISAQTQLEKIELLQYCQNKIFEQENRKA